MFHIIYHFVFIIFTTYLFIKSSIYGLYEIKNKKNIFGGISIILLNVFCLFFVNIMIYVHL